MTEKDIPGTMSCLHLLTEEEVEIAGKPRYFKMRRGGDSGYRYKLKKEAWFDEPIRIDCPITPPCDLVRANLPIMRD